MNFSIRHSAVSSLIVVCGTASAQINDLPIVKILGENYYFYEVTESESPYGLAKRFGWDVKTLSEVNPEMNSPLEKGSVVYYPVPHSEIDTSEAEPSRKHTVARGETVYSLANKYHVTVDAIYAANPKSQHGIVEGEMLEIPLGDIAANTEGGYVYHKIEPGETLYSVARRYNSTVADLMRANRGLSEDNFPAGATIRITPGSRAERKVREKVSEKKVVSVTNYRVRKKDTWEKIARATGVDPDTLKAANPTVGILEKNIILAIPHTEEVEVTREVIVDDPREATPEGRRELFEEVQRGNLAAGVRVAVVLENVDSNKDQEFMRGFIYAIDGMKLANFKTHLAVVDSGEGKESTIEALDNCSPDIILTTHDHDFPTYIADYARTLQIPVVNVFDVKNEDYLTNPEVIQLLTPSTQFYDETAAYAGRRFEDAQLIIAGEVDPSDPMAPAFISAFNGITETVPLDMLKDYDTTASNSLLIYGSPSRRDDVVDLLAEVNVLKEKNPMAEVTVIGRPSWITLSDVLGDRFSDLTVYVPSRFYFDPEDPASREFIEGYRQLYGHTPMKSFPVYAAAGYDVARYFIPGMVESRGDLDSTWPAIDNLQTDFSLRNEAGIQGHYNPVVYLVKFNSFGDVDKIKVE